MARPAEPPAAEPAEQAEPGPETAALDREWQQTRESLMVRGKGGAPAEPSVVRAALLALVGVGGAVFAWFTAANSDLPAAVVYGLPIAFAALGLYTAATTLTAAVRWHRAEADYRRRVAATKHRPVGGADDTTL